MSTQQPSRQDDLAQLLGILADAPLAGFSLNEIQDRAAGWSLMHVNKLVCALGSQVDHLKSREKGSGMKVTRYWLRSRS